MIRQCAGYLARHPLMRKLAVSTPVVRDLAWRYVAGESLDAGIAAVRTLNARGIKGTLNFVGTHVRNEADCVLAADAAIEALRRMQHEGVDSHYSLKLTQIGLDVSPEFCRQQTRRVLDAASQAGNFVRIDMEESPYVDVTLSLFDEMRQIYGADTVGIVIQSYLRHRHSDLERLIAQDARVRLVKGGYWEAPSVAFNKKADIDRAFERDAELLLTRGRLPAIASHDARIIEHVCRVAESLKLSKHQFEFQMLYGVRPDLQDSLVQQGYAVRCYVPYGGQWYAYFIGCVRKSLGDVVDRFTGAGRADIVPQGGAKVRSYVLSTDDAERWRQVLPASANVYASVEYVKLCAQESRCAGRLFVVEANDATVAYPFFVRTLDALPFAAEFAGVCDTFTPTYTGPVHRGNGATSLDFASAFARYCREQRIVTEFAHLSPWTDCSPNLDPACIEVNREVVYVDLSWDAERIWRESLSSDCRRQTKQSQTAGVAVRRATSPADVDQFHRLHTETMNRRHAHERYYFDTNHFQTIFATMPDHAFFVLAEYEGKVIAGGMFLQDDEYLYWDLSAADMEYGRVRPVNAYVHDTICKSLGQGRKRMLLGGAFQAGDGIFRFKSGFSPLREKFCIYKKVHDGDTYAALTQAWSRYHAGAQPVSGFFPAYRSSLPTSES